MLVTLALWIAYDGSRFSGWQRQSKERTVQGEIENAIYKVIGTYVTIHASGRTDAGVHAKGQCASLTVDLKMPIGAFKMAINRRLSGDVRVLNIFQMPDNFHARYDAVGKTYVYQIYNGPFEDPFIHAFATHEAGFLNEAAIREAMKAFLGTHDFKGFMASGSQVKSTVRTIQAFDLCIKDNLWTFSITGDGFLYNMVRIIIGLLIRVGQCLILPSEVQGIILSQNREKAKWTAPANGLYLYDVIYPQEINKFFTNDIDKSLDML